MLGTYHCVIGPSTGLVKTSDFIWVFTLFCFGSGMFFTVRVYMLGSYHCDRTKHVV